MVVQINFDAIFLFYVVDIFHKRITFSFPLSYNIIYIHIYNIFLLIVSLPLCHISTLYAWVVKI